MRVQTKEIYHGDFRSPVNNSPLNGRYPSNVILDEFAAEILDGQSGIKKGNGHWSQSKVSGFGKFGNGKCEYSGVGEKDTAIGGASRFFYVPKASKKEKGELNTHPTVKPVNLLQYLVRLVCKKGGVVLDPFMGSGSTGVACKKEGMRFIGIEKEEEYFQIANTRMEEY